MTLRRRSRTVSVWVLTTMPSAHGVVHEAGTPLAPSTSTRHIRQDPNASSESVAHSFGMATPASVAARITDVPAGTSTWRPSMVTAPSRRSPDRGRAEVDLRIPDAGHTGAPSAASSRLEVLAGSA